MRTLAETRRGRAHFEGTATAVARAVLPKLWAAVLFEPRDLWCGAYWEVPETGWRHAVDVYVCVVPTLPIRLSIRHSSARQVRHDVRRAWYYWRAQRKEATYE